MEMKSILVEFIQKYASVSDEQAGVLADYALATWQPLPDEVKYLHIAFKPAKGNTILGRVMAAICKNPMIANQLSTHLCLLSELDSQYPATLIIEENYPRSEDMVMLLKSGWGRYMSIIRMVTGPEGNACPKNYITHGYKIILGGLHLVGHSVFSRCIRVELDQVRDVIPVIVLDDVQFSKDAAQIGVILDAMYGIDDDGVAV